MSKIFGKWVSKDTDNLTHDGDDLAVKFSDGDAADANKVWSSEKVATISGALSAEIDADMSTHQSSADHDGRYYTETELDSGQLDNQYYTETELDGGQLDDRYYTEAEVDTISGALNTKIDAVGGVDAVEYLTLDSDDITNKYVVLANTPYSVTETMMDIIGGGSQIYGTDYTVSGPQLSWDSLDLDGVLEAADKMRVSYTYSA